MQKRKRLWKTGDVIVPRLNKCPKCDLEVTILEVRKTGYYVDDGNKKEEIEHKYLEGSYISENGIRIYTWTLLKTKGEEDGKDPNANPDKGPRRKKRRKTQTDNDVQEVGDDGSVRKRPRRTSESSGSSKKSRQRT